MLIWPISFLQWTEWMIGLLDWETVDYLWSRLCCSRHLPFWLRYFEGLKFLRPFTLTRPLGHGVKMEFWKMSGNLLKYKKWGGGWVGGVGGNMGCDGVPSRWSGSIWVTWCFRTSSFQDLTFRGITPRPKWASPCLL